MDGSAKALPNTLDGVLQQIAERLEQAPSPELRFAELALSGRR
jgi:hypothetical protein